MQYSVRGISGSSILASQLVLVTWSTVSLTFRSGQFDAKVAHELPDTILKEKNEAGTEMNKGNLRGFHLHRLDFSFSSLFAFSACAHT